MKRPALQNKQVVETGPRFADYIKHPPEFFFFFEYDFKTHILFAAILRYQHNQNNVNPVVKKVYFFWICPDTNAFEWFTDLLQYLEDRVSLLE